ncbi:MAG TPA: hypothetical protein VME92_16890 [Acetobacteraceae bacterium]|nr:hypothetical protein [Acetobacteraceae bacterium]
MASDEPAPVPDADMLAPIPTGPDGPSVSPTLFRPMTGYRGAGFPWGASVDGPEHRDEQPVPELQVSVPLRWPR